MTRRKIRQTARFIPAFALTALLIPLMVVADQRKDAASDASAARDAAATPTAERLTAIADVQRGQPVVLQGEVVRLRDDDEFELRDETGAIEVYIGWQNAMPVQVGDQVTVRGVADDDVLPGFGPGIYARTIVLPGGDEVTLRLDD